MKTCFKCHQTKPLTDFYNHPQTADGHLGKCKGCTKRDVRQNYAENREEYSAYDQKRQQTADRRAKKADYQREYRARDVQKYKAHMAVTNAVRDGRLIPQPCACGGVAEAHHEDYSKPLDVEWLCFKCHREQKHDQTVTTRS